MSRAESHAEELAAQPRDTLILPLLAPFAPMVLRLGEFEWLLGEREQLDADLALLATEPDLTARAARVAAMRAGAFASTHGSELSHTLADSWIERKLHPGISEAELALKWLEKAVPPLPVVAVVAAALSGGPGPSVPAWVHLPPHATARMLYTYAARSGVTDWNSAYLASREYWADAEHRERLLVEGWRYAWAELDSQEDLIVELERELLEWESPGSTADLDEPDVRPPGLRLVTDPDPPRPRRLRRGRPRPAPPED